MTDVFTVNPGEDNLTLDVGFYSKCDNITDPGTISGEQFLCGPGITPGELGNVTLPSGGSGEMEYLWMKSTIGGPFDVSTWESIEGATGLTYTPEPLSETTYFIRCARRECCSSYLESNIIKIDVGSIAIAEISGPEIVCSGEVFTFYSAAHDSDAVIEWDFGPTASPRYVSGSPAMVTFSNFGLVNIRLEVTEQECTSIDERRLTVSNSPSYCSNGLQINVKAMADQAQVMVEWELAANNEFSYEVEYSKDGEQFEVIGSVLDPMYTQDGMKYYEFVDDRRKLGRSYYRVRLFDDNGADRYSATKEVVLLGDSELLLYYPNPVVDAINVELFEDFGEEVELELLHPNGTILQRIDLGSGGRGKQLNVSSYPSGIYLMRVNYGGIEVKVLKIMKQ